MACPSIFASDNGPEFIATAIRRHGEQAGLEMLYIEPGSPWENGYAESFFSRLRDELLNCRGVHATWPRRGGSLVGACRSTTTSGRTAAWATRPPPSSPPRVLLPLRLRLRSSSTREHKTKSLTRFPIHTLITLGPKTGGRSAPLRALRKRRPKADVEEHF